MDRRSFIKLATAAAVAPGTCSRLFAKTAAEFDENLTVFFSDVHVNGVAGRPEYQYPLFAAKVAEVLRMDPLPRHVLIFGDLAWIFGEKADYEKSLPLIRQMKDVGIDVRITMGNHDHRRSFFDLYPEQEKATPVPGRVVSVVNLGTADFLLIDSLDENPKGAGADNPVPGKLPADVQDWLAAELKTRTRPFFVGAHHPVRELSVGGKSLLSCLDATPACAGYIHGHDHRWVPYWYHRNYRDQKIFRHLCLPSTGHWGDIGYCVFKTEADRAVATLRQNDFFFPVPLRPGQPRPKVWDEKVAEHKNARCAFLYA